MYEYVAAKNGKKMQFVNKIPVPLEEHTKCKCDCGIKESDCSKLQTYNKTKCSCNCINLQERDKCYAENALKFWDTDSCSCQCRNIVDCSSGTKFDLQTCQCAEVSLG